MFKSSSSLECLVVVVVLVDVDMVIGFGVVLTEIEKNTGSCLALNLKIDL